MKKIWITAVLVFLPMVAMGQNGAGTDRAQTAWSLHSGAWNMTIVEEDSAQADSLYFYADSDGDTTFWSHWFYGWPHDGLHILIGDTLTAADSFKVTFELFQYGFGYNPDQSDTTKSIFMKTLSWRSHTSSTASDTITAAGYYGAMLTDTAILPFRYWWLRAHVHLGNSKKAGNDWVKIVNNGWRGAR